MERQFEKRARIMGKVLREGASSNPFEARFLVALKKVETALLEAEKAWDYSNFSTDFCDALDTAYQEYFPDAGSFEEMTSDFASFSQELRDKFAMDVPLRTRTQEASNVEFTRLGKYIKGMAIPGSSRTSDELFNLIDKDGGVHEQSLVVFFRSRGGLPSISEEDIVELEDLIDKAWQAGRSARSKRDTGAGRDMRFGR